MLERSPQVCEIFILLILRLAKFLEALDGSQRMFVHGVAVIKVAHHQRIDGAEFRQYIREQAQAVHRPQCYAWIISGEDTPNLSPGHFLVGGPQLRMRENVGDAAFGLVAERYTDSGSFCE